MAWFKLLVNPYFSSNPIAHIAHLKLVLPRARRRKASWSIGRGMTWNMQENRSSFCSIYADTCLFLCAICINLSTEQLNARFCPSLWLQHGTTLLHKAFFVSRIAVIWLPICKSMQKCALGLSICYQPWTQKGYDGKESLNHEHSTFERTTMQWALSSLNVLDDKRIFRDFLDTVASKSFNLSIQVAWTMGF